MMARPPLWTGWRSSRLRGLGEWTRRGSFVLGSCSCFTGAHGGVPALWGAVGQHGPGDACSRRFALLIVLVGLALLGQLAPARLGKLLPRRRHLLFELLAAPCGPCRGIRRRAADTREASSYFVGAAVPREPHNETGPIPQLDIMNVNELLRLLRCLLIVCALDHLWQARRVARSVDEVDAVEGHLSRLQFKPRLERDSQLPLTPARSIRAAYNGRQCGGAASAELAQPDLEAPPDPEALADQEARAAPLALLARAVPADLARYQRATAGGLRAANNRPRGTAKIFAPTPPTHETQLDANATRPCSTIPPAAALRIAQREQRPPASVLGSMVARLG